jgi:hypothetical protein
MPETAGTAGTTAEKIERPSFGDIYNDLTGFDDEAVAVHMGYEIESLFDGLNDGSLSSQDGVNVVRACEFLRKRKELVGQVPDPDAMAAQLVKEMTRRELNPISTAYYAASMPDVDEVPDPESPEGKAGPSSAPSAEPSDTSDPVSTQPGSATSD